jgi:hypothetical protein
MVHSAHSPALPLVRGLLLPRWLAIGRVCSRLTHARSRGSPRDAARSFLPRAAPHSCQQHGAPSIPIIMEMITQAHTGPRHRPGDAGFLLWCPFYCGVMVGVGVAREAADLARRATGFPGDRLSGPQGMPGFFSADRQASSCDLPTSLPIGGIARAGESSGKINGIGDIALTCRSDDTTHSRKPRRHTCLAREPVALPPDVVGEAFEQVRLRLVGGSDAWWRQPQLPQSDAFPTELTAGQQLDFAPGGRRSRISLALNPG